MRLPRDGDPENGRLKGFGYADFETRQDLIVALGYTEHSLKGRKIRVDLSTHAGQSDRGGDRRMGRGYVEN